MFADDIIYVTARNAEEIGNTLTNELAGRPKLASGYLATISLFTKEKMNVSFFIQTRN